MTASASPRFTCLIPAYDEAARIGGVLDAVVGHPLIAAVIVVDDGSRDATAAVAEARGARVVRTPGNLGKTRALAAGLQVVTTSHVVLIDADLVGLTPAAITALVEPVRRGLASAAISLRGNAPLTWRLIGIDYISGERVFSTALLAGQSSRLARLPRFGFEVFLNDRLIETGTTLAIVLWPGVASPSKAAKLGLRAGVRADLAMMADIFRTVGPLTCLKQIVSLRRLAERSARPPSPAPSGCIPRPPA
jgi:cellulose synthase/poly-beta-1,6-N-acetylglucosamine synthase-like glycosyltransferase